MKISPLATPQNTVAAGGGDPQLARPLVRSLKMNTKATPGVIETPPPAPAAEKVANPDTSDTAAETVEATEPLSPQLAALAKQKRALQVKERELLAREEALKNQPSTQEGMISIADIKAKPLSVLLDAGVTYDQITEAILADQSSNGPEIQALKAQIKALEEGVNKRLSDKDADAEKAVLAEMRKEAEKLSAEGEDFELVRATNSIPQVMELIERTYRENGEVLDVREAMTLVENELISESLKLAALKKVQGRLQPESAAPQTPQQRPRTLTNRDTAVPPMDRKQRALLAFAGQLNK